LWPASTAISVFLSFALVRLVAPDRAHVSDAVLALLAFAAAGRVTLAGNIQKSLMQGSPTPTDPRLIP
jgi:hypothetical protein